MTAGQVNRSSARPPAGRPQARAQVVVGDQPRRAPAAAAGSTAIAWLHSARKKS